MRQIVVHPQIGEITIVTYANSRSVRYSVSANRVLITCPPRELKHIFPLSQERVDWILQSQAKLQTKLNSAPKSSLLETTFSTPLRSYRFEHADLPKDILANVSCSEHECIIHIANEAPVNDQKMRNRIEKLIEYQLKKDAQIYITQRLAELALQHNFEYHSLKINSAKTRWGSCSGRKSINISCYTLLLPSELIDLVLVHELTHTREMNHSQRFHNIMRGIFSNYDELQKQMKSQHIRSFL